MSKAMIAVFEDGPDATAAVDRLLKLGVDDSRISVLTTDDTARSSLGIDTHSKGTEGVAVGGTVGAATVGLLAGLTAVGTIASGGIGVLVAGPLAAALAGAGAGAITGGALGGLIGLGYTEHEIKHFESALEKGAVLVAIDMKDAEDEAMVKGVLADANAREASAV